jgi:hypothetical protein
MPAFTQIGGRHDLVVHELLDPVQRRLAPLAVELARFFFSSPTFSTYFFGTIQPAPVAVE